ncbi:MAG TPA: nucleotidyl transferase AbiEii/AbiGii toxin family protein, partial [Burkholderiaceae bacterium]|nr:nucleotidyl transferase AbiEii/AbiGii toxin family protein [Burkholderiaceae bacterium]
MASVLEALAAELLEAHGCLFGGGTAMALRYGEYRESVDIDFLVSDRDGYRDLRQRLSGPAGIQAIVRPGRTLQQQREVRTDQYGMRTMLRVGDVGIKFEIVFEARIALEPPGSDDRLCGIATLTPLDMATRKLLANSDRWRDDAVFSRDLIDLAMMAPGKKLLREATDKAKEAYGASIEADLT